MTTPSLFDQPERATCPTCGATMVEYRHSLNVGLVTGLAALHSSGGGPINLGDLGLTRSQWDNFQKLRYWGLVAPSYDGDVRRRGVWQITEKGRLFVTGVTVIQRVARTYRGRTVGYEGALVRVDYVDKRYKLREEYVADATPHTKEH